MGREPNRAAHGAGPGGYSKERHRRTLRKMSSGSMLSNVRLLNPRPEVPSLKSKHQSYYELVENKDKKKKLELQITSNRDPPPGFEFVPIGNPELTQACKEISREQDAMIFIVSTNKTNIQDSLAHHVNRIGHHIRQTIVEQAREEIGESSDDSAIGQKLTGDPEPIPETQQEINEQADKAIRDLFPRIPNTDRQMIIEHSFKKGAHKKRGPLVGLAQDITLSRRVQLAVLAHIRHTHTRYDQLLKETTYPNARKAVEALCLDILVKWRGDEETGRDQLDEILREVIVISDSEGEEDGDEDDDEHDNTDDEEEDSSAAESGDAAERPASRESTYSPPPATTPVLAQRAPEHGSFRPLHMRPAPAYISAHAYNTRKRPGVRTGWRGFDRYQAALEARWGEAQVRVRRQEEQPSEAVSHAPRPYELAPHRDPSQERRQHTPKAVPYYDTQRFSGHQYDVRHDNTLPGYDRNAPRPVAAYVENVRPRSGGRYVPPVYAYEEARAPDAPPNNHIPSETFKPYSSFDQPLHVHRHTVSSEQTRDYLVPSIEPSAPPSMPRPSSPQHGHAASSYAPAFYTIEPTDITQGRTNKRHSPTWPGDSYASTKRRRFLGDETGMHRSSPSQEPLFHHRPMREERDQLKAYVGDEIRASAARPSPYVAPPPILQSLPTAPSVNHGRFHTDSGLALRGDQSRPIVVEDWESRASPSLTPFPVQNYREEPVAQRRADFVAEIRHDTIRPSIEDRRSMSREYSTSRRPEKDHFARYRAVHENSLAGSVRETESSAYYSGTRTTTSNAAEPRPLGYRRSPPPLAYPPHAGHHNTEPEPVPQYLRDARRQENQLPSNGRPFEEPAYAQYRDRYSQQPPDSGGYRRYYGHPPPSNPPHQ